MTVIVDPGLHINQRRIAQCEARFRVVACGRRFGKTHLGKWLTIERALRGETCWWLTPTYAMAGDVWRELKSAFTGVDAVTINASDRRIEFAGAGSIAVRSAHYPDNLRGAGLDFVVLDEAAFMEPSVWPEVVRPMLLERKGHALFLSTPYGRNWFWRLFQLGNDPAEPEWASFQFTSMDNPYIDPAEFESIRRSTPERVFRAEYSAEFVEDAGQVFRGITAAATAVTGAQPQPDHRYVMGVDWGRDGDYTAIAVTDATTGHMVALERFTGVGYHLQRGRLAALYKTWNPAVIWAEANSIGSVNIEELQREGLPVRPFTTTARSKAPLIESLALAIERGEIALLPDPVLLDELNAYTIERLHGGGFRYSAPSGGHDDTVIATALSWHGVTQGTMSLTFA